MVSKQACGVVFVTMLTLTAIALITTASFTALHEAKTDGLNLQPGTVATFLGGIAVGVFGLRIGKKNMEKKNFAVERCHQLKTELDDLKLKNRMEAKDSAEKKQKIARQEMIDLKEKQLGKFKPMEPESYGAHDADAMKFRNYGAAGLACMSIMFVGFATASSGDSCSADAPTYIGMFCGIMGVALLFGNIGTNYISVLQKYDFCLTDEKINSRYGTKNSADRKQKFRTMHGTDASVPTHVHVPAAAAEKRTQHNVQCQETVPVPMSVANARTQDAIPEPVNKLSQAYSRDSYVAATSRHVWGSKKHDKSSESSSESIPESRESNRLISTSSESESDSERTATLLARRRMMIHLQL